MILTGLPSIQIHVPGLGRVRYVRGEAVPQAHVNLLPDAERQHFEQPQAAYEPPAGDDATGDGSELEGIEGIGPRRLAALRRAGIEQLAELIDADADALAAEASLSAERIEEWQAAAEQLVAR